MAQWHQYANAFAPWNHRLGSGWRIRMPSLRELLDTIDAAYHCRYVAMPACGHLCLRRLVARLHSRPLDLSRPPWECYLIDGLSDRRFAIYIKRHHALIDGVAGMQLLVRSLADSEAWT